MCLTIPVTCASLKMNQVLAMMSSQKPFRGNVSNHSPKDGLAHLFPDIQKNHKPGSVLDGKKKNGFLSLNVKQPHVNCWVVSRYDG